MENVSHDSALLSDATHIFMVDDHIKIPRITFYFLLQLIP